MTLNAVNTRLLIKDFQACFHYYRDILGFSVTWDDGDYGSFQDGSIRLAIFKREMMAKAIHNEVRWLMQNLKIKICVYLKSTM